VCRIGFSLVRPAAGHAEPGCEEALFTANRILIAGLLAGGPASKLRDKLRPGDWLRSIDGQQV
jgi:hypothetical protein